MKVKKKALIKIEEIRRAKRGRELEDNEEENRKSYVNKEMHERDRRGYRGECRNDEGRKGWRVVDGRGMIIFRRRKKTRKKVRKKNK